MRKLLLALLLSGPALADVTATISTPSKVDKQLLALVLRTNGQTCARNGLPANCTQADVNAVPGSGNPTIYASGTAGVNKYVSDRLTNAVTDMARNFKGDLQSTAGVTLDAGTNAQQNSACAVLNAIDPIQWPLATGCWP